jgi:very-short-patch-repair endonuclease
VDVAVARGKTVSPGLILRTGNKTSRESLPAEVTQVVMSTSAPSSETMAALEGAAYRSTINRDAYFTSLQELAASEEAHLRGLQSEEELLSSIQEAGSINVDDEQVDYLLKRLDRLQRRRMWRSFRWKRLAKHYKLPIEVKNIGTVSDWLRVRLANVQRIVRIASLREIVGDRSACLSEIDEVWRSNASAYIEGLIGKQVQANKQKWTSLSTATSSFKGMLRSVEELSLTFKGWASTTLSLHPNFPLKAAMFDYVIVDEASQCQLAYVVPAAYRAKRIIVVGDANQLQPITSLSEEQERAIAVRNGISVTDLEEKKLSSVRYSAFDAFSSLVGLENVQLLNEHYRSHPKIARWFNETFYFSQLRVLTDVAEFDLSERAITWLDIGGEATPPSPSQSSWTNRKEADAVVEIVEKQLAKRKSVGVVTPFRRQAELIEELSRARFGCEELSQIDFRVGTAHRFQGDERDTMIFSCVLAPGIAKRTAQWVEREKNLINVAVSRAKERLIVIGHPDIHQFDCPTLTSLRHFIADAPDGIAERIGPRFDSIAEQRLYESLLQQSFDPMSKFNVEGYELDFAIFLNDKRYDIEVDGDQHFDESSRQNLRQCRQDVARDRILRRVNWDVIRVPAWECFSAPDAVAFGIAQYVHGAIEAEAIPAET